LHVLLPLFIFLLFIRHFVIKIIITFITLKYFSSVFSLILNILALLTPSYPLIPARSCSTTLRHPTHQLSTTNTIATRVKIQYNGISDMLKAHGPNICQPTGRKNLKNVNITRQKYWAISAGCLT
jgi:hypothetical protein